MSKIHELRSVTTLPQLARLLDIKGSTLSFALYWIRHDKKYVSFEIPKKNGGVRVISAPCSRLKVVQRRLANLLLQIQMELEQKRTKEYCVVSHGFKKDFSIVTNAMRHHNKRYVFNVDIQDFFSSINFGRVRGFFLLDRNLLLNTKISTILAQIACHDNKLPQGSPCSPVISNFLGHIIDMQLVRLAREGRCTYTRYVDDLTFSTNERVFPTEIASLVVGSLDRWVIGDNLTKIVSRSGYKLNIKKTRMQTRNSRQDATGLIVNKLLLIMIKVLPSYSSVSVQFWGRLLEEWIHFTIFLEICT